MQTIYQDWAEAVALFERRGLPESSYENLDQTEYILHPGSASLPGSLRLDDHEHRQLNPWINATGRPQYEGIDGAVTGYIIDGDLDVNGNILNLDDGSPALVVLGDLRAANIHLEGDVKLVVRGSVEVETFVGNWTDKLVMIDGDLLTTVTILWNEFCPDLVGGCLRGRALTPRYLDLADQNIGRVEDPSPDAALADLFVPEVLVAEDADDSDRDAFAPLGLSRLRLVDRLERGLPVVRGGRIVPAQRSDP